MAKTHRKYTEAQKIRILAYSRKHGPAATAKKYGVATSLLHYWRQNGLEETSEPIPDVKTVLRDAIKRTEREIEASVSELSGYRQALQALEALERKD